MRRKTMLLAVAALGALAFAALPSLAAAAETGPEDFGMTPAVSLPEGEEFPVEFSGEVEKKATLYEETAAAVTCQSGVSYEGEFTDAHTGSVTFTFHGCREEVLNSTCTTSGQSSGTIKTTTLPFHTVYLEPENPEDLHERPGVLFTPNGETTVNEKHWFAHFSCVGGFVNVTVGGNGVAGTITEPTIGGGASNSFTVDVSTIEAGEQANMQQHPTVLVGTDEEGKPVYETFELAVSKNGGETVGAAEDVGPATAQYAEGLQPTTTTETS